MGRYLMSVASRGRWLLTLTTAWAIVLIGAASVQADEPQREFSFTGRATINGEPAPLATTIEIEVNGKLIGEGLVSGDDGKWVIQIDAELLQDGICEAVFYVNGQPADRQWNRCAVDIRLEVGPEATDTPEEEDVPEIEDDPEVPESDDHPVSPDHPDSDGDPGPPDDEPENEGDPQDPESEDVPEAPEDPEVEEDPEAPEGPEIDDDPDAPDGPEIDDNPDAPDGPNGPEHPDAPDAPDGPEIDDKPDVPDGPNAPEHPDEPDGPNAPEHPDEPDQAETMDAPPGETTRKPPDQSAPKIQPRSPGTGTGGLTPEQRQTNWGVAAFVVVGVAVLALGAVVMVSRRSAWSRR